jgi:hypothetical protein
MCGQITLKRLSKKRGPFLIHLVIKMGIMFYAVEFVLRNMAGRWNAPTVSALWALGVIAVRGLVL